MHREVPKNHFQVMLLYTYETITQLQGIKAESVSFCHCIRKTEVSNAKI